MRDADVRRVVRQKLGEVHFGDPDTLIVEEMGIWSGSARVDLAVINGELHGIELKSERDTLERLPDQSAIYNLVFDRVTLVVATNHIKSARQIIPKWWGLISVSSATCGLKLGEIRQPKLNPRISSFHLARLLWRDELLASLQQHGGTKGIKSHPVDRLARVLETRLSLDELRDEVRSMLKNRSDWLGKRASDQVDMPVSSDFNPLGATAGR